MAVEVSRRGFLGGAIAAAGMSGGAAASAAEAAISAHEGASKPLIASAPVLQNAAERSMGVAFAVSADASGWVDVSMSPDMCGAKRVYSGGLGMMEVNDRIAQIIVRGLRPATRYWYRIGADRIEYGGGYAIPLFHPNADDPTLPCGEGVINGRCAAWSRPCARRWLPLLEKAGIDLVVSGHRHSFHIDMPTEGRRWMQIVGGGCDPDPANKYGFPSIVEGRVTDGRLAVTIHNCATGKVVADKVIENTMR